MTNRPPSAPQVKLTYRGQDITASAGQTVAAALIRNGISAWRITRRGDVPRGLFCGIGVCYDCLLTVDGVSGQRACLVEVVDGMRLGDAPDVPGTEEQ
ncbi:(2Fe-2S)-binding protein [Natronoglycomyces albus]|uniref:(2Fe-2S)-binding protein n=1 Tax=Natronoglycomyces albus TaxID=2811108 RepID=A0A895XP50_9ACTN|nr:(2Fe-2S)-binding protein [Natronoglycomyces albus]QSB05159.1 (2Fe-2S)-binding protein [Natronoglycomyces albus]